MLYFILPFFLSMLVVQHIQKKQKEQQEKELQKKEALRKEKVEEARRARAKDAERPPELEYTMNEPWTVVWAPVKDKPLSKVDAAGVDGVTKHNVHAFKNPKNNNKRVFKKDTPKDKKEVKAKTPKPDIVKTVKTVETRTRKDGKKEVKPNFSRIASEWVYANSKQLNKICADAVYVMQMNKGNPVETIIPRESLPKDRESWDYIAKALIDTDDGISKAITTSRGIEIIVE